MTFVVRIILPAMLALALMVTDASGKEVIFKPDDDYIDNLNKLQEDEADVSKDNSRIDIFPLPLCAIEVEQIRLGDTDDAVEYLPSTYNEVRCKEQVGQAGTTREVCSSPINKRFPPSDLWGSTACLQRWDTIPIFWRPMGVGNKWQKYEERQVPNGCECVIITPELVDVDQHDSHRELSPQEPRMMPVAVQRYAKSNRYGRSVEANL